MPSKASILEKTKLIAIEPQQLDRRGLGLPRNTKVNQLWVSDITFIRLGNEFVYLAVG